MLQAVLKEIRSSSFFIILIVVSFTQAQTYYLDAVAGIDTNPGSSDLPWQTFTKAQSSIVSGDTVILQPGSYGPFTQKKTYTDWVTYKSASPHAAITGTVYLIKSSAYFRFDGL